MVKLNDAWKVLPHGPLEEVEPGLLTVVGQIPMPLGNFPRRMTVVALGRNRTAISNPTQRTGRRCCYVDAVILQMPDERFDGTRMP